MLAILSESSSLPLTTASTKEFGSHSFSATMITLFFSLNLSIFSRVISDLNCARNSSVKIIGVLSSASKTIKGFAPCGVEDKETVAPSFS
ncbi:hypothetical protein P9046_05460 [Bacillus cereus]|uniref:hypothetical protein n=1 Tax=Bacillus thuringiensis TaxID=1428 RepID=UPI001EE639F5|nr:hypothetical protein [Bacillus thuringiensis]MEC2876098.1 hypothetical protein [Bacillus cereus]MEC3069089.1 hypothetical protein [Bacillus cereus]MEC3090845.1 hypothetical protein [Bacillus cereus]MEC3143126.1 hypothetical protein [Bacillus thuringiensis]MEC3300494.1 hypothetical protein [Bacillus cereus]